MAETGTEEKSWPGFTGQCNPDVWNEKAKPKQPEQGKIGQLTEAQIDEYFREVGRTQAFDGLMSQICHTMYHF